MFTQSKNSSDLYGVSLLCHPFLSSCFIYLFNVLSEKQTNSSGQIWTGGKQTKSHRVENALQKLNSACKDCGPPVCAGGRAHGWWNTILALFCLYVCACVFSRNTVVKNKQKKNKTNFLWKTTVQITTQYIVNYLHASYASGYILHKTEIWFISHRSKKLAP